MRTSLAMPNLRVAALAFLAATVALGLALRWEFVSGWMSAQGLEFTSVRHAHSHAGFYGVLTLAWWAVALAAGKQLLSWTAARAHIGCAALATVLFALQGYAAPTIVLSTMVAGFWLVAAWRLWRARAALDGGWLIVTPGAILLGVMVIPAIAVTARRDPLLSRSLAHLFIATILLAVFAPAAWHALKVPRRQPAWLFLFIVVGAAAAMVFPAQLQWIGSAMILMLAVSIAAPMMNARISWVLKAQWIAVAGMLAGAALVPALQTDIIRIAGIHYMVLGPVLTSLGVALLPGRPWPVAAALYHAALFMMVGAIPLPSLVPSEHGALVAALASSLFVASALLLGVTWRRAPCKATPCPPMQPIRT